MVCWFIKKIMLNYVDKGDNMYNFKKLKNEKIELIEDNCILLYEGKKRDVSVILTNMRLILLDYPDGTDYQETLRVSRGVNYMRNKEEFFSLNISDIINIEKDKYLLNNGNYFYLKTKEIGKKIQEN